MDDLDRELNSWMTMEFTWFKNNCAFLACNWVLKVKGVDPAASIRDSFDSFEGCQRVTGYFRDPVGVTKKFFADCGLNETSAPKRGDVGILRAPGEDHPLMGVYTGVSWAFKHQDRGVKSWHPQFVQVLVAWDIGVA